MMAGQSQRTAIAGVAVAVVTSVLAAGGCGGGSSSPGGNDLFIAFAKDFAGFRTWPSHTTESPVSR